MASIILSNVPEICTREDLVQNVLLSQSNVDYILHPLGKDSTRALVAFKSQKGETNIKIHRHTLNIKSEISRGFLLRGLIMTGLS